MKLTKRAIDRAKYTGKRYQDGTYSRCVLWDDAVGGFGLRILPSERKVFILKYKVGGRSRVMTIGRHGPITLEQARKKACKLVAEILDGKDPLEFKLKGNSTATVGELCDAYMERHSKPDKNRPGKKSWKMDRWRIDRYIKPKWKNRRVDSVRRSDVSVLINRIGKDSIYEANNTLRLISSMFTKAQEFGFLEENASNPAHGVPKYKETKRDRWLKPGEVRRLVKAIDASTNRCVRWAIWLYLLTGVRKSELLNAKWDDVDWDRRELRLPDTKAGRTHYVALSKPAIQILRGIPHQERDEYIIPGGKPGQPLVNFTKPWSKIREQARLEDVRLHDLRRTVASWMAQSGNSLLVIQHVLNHSTETATRIYARLGQDPSRKALEEHGKKLLSVTGKRKRGEVVPMRRKRKRKKKKSSTK